MQYEDTTKTTGYIGFN